MLESNYDAWSYNETQMGPPTTTQSPQGGKIASCGKMLVSTLEVEEHECDAWSDEEYEHCNHRWLKSTERPEWTENKCSMLNSSSRENDDALNEEWCRADERWMSSWKNSEGNLRRDRYCVNEDCWRDGSTNDDGSSQDPDWSDDDEHPELGHDIIGGSAYCKGGWIAGGGFADVFLAWDTDSGQTCAAKIGDDESLGWEAEVLNRLSGEPGFPTLHYFGEHNNQGALIKDCLGTDLAKLQKNCGGSFSLRTVLHIADQVLRRIEALHATGIIHRDIKPENFVIGCGEKTSTIHLIDFGLADEYRDKATRKQSLYLQNAFIGTPVYASVHAHKFEEQSWRDDLEAIGYMLVSLLQGDLPWECDGKHCSSDEEWIEHCAKRKGLLPPTLICTGCPKEFSEYLRYCRQLKFDQIPDYEKLRGMFRKVFDREGFEDDLVLDWTNFDKGEFHMD
jgi:hypothetical protein